MEQADDAFCRSALRLLDVDAEFCPLCDKLLEDNALALAAAWLLFLAAGTSWLCFPSYVVMTAFGSCDDLSICFFTSHPWNVHL
uniref:WRKY4 n=1 Tax=Arundo donax TaxID=35708 RepID=A0A0A9G2J3_ARUDO